MITTIDSNQPQSTKILTVEIGGRMYRIMEDMDRMKITLVNEGDIYTTSCLDPKSIIIIGDLV